MNIRDINQINKNLRELIKINNIPFYKKWEFIIAIATVILAIVSIIIAQNAVDQDLRISGQQQKIDGFKELLENSEIQKDTLTKAVGVLSTQLNILSNQLKLNQEQQELSRNENTIKNKNYETEFRIVETRIRNMLWTLPDNLRNSKDWDSTSRIVFLDEIQDIVKKGLSNPFLQKSPKLYQEWENVYGKISLYIRESVFEYNFRGADAKKEIDITWRNCLFSIIKLGQNTNNYLDSTSRNNKKYNNWYRGTLDTTFSKIN